MTFINVEVSYKTAPAELLESLSLNAEGISKALVVLGSHPWVEEVLLLSTCNRSEVYISTSRTDDSTATAITDFLGSLIGVPADSVRASGVIRRDTLAVEHLLSVACGLESMAVGEDQIVAQIRESLRIAREARTVGPHLAGLVAAALRTSKRARTETGIGSVGISLVHAGLAIGREQLGSLAGRTALLIGSGTIGNLAGRLLHADGARLLVSSRTWASAVRLTESIGDGEPVRPERLDDALARADIIVTSTAARDPVLRPNDLEGPRARRAHAPLFVLDLAMPHDVDASCAEIPGVLLLNLRDLGTHLAEQGCPAHAEAARRIVAEETAAVVAHTAQKIADPLILALRSRVRAFAKAELERLFRSVPTLDEREREAAEAAFYRLAGKFLHGPTKRTKEMSATDECRVCLDVVTRIFDLDAREARV